MNTSYSSFSPNQLASFFVLPPDCIFLLPLEVGSYTISDPIRTEKLS